MAAIAIVGDGPAGLSAALFLAKNGQQATVYGQDETAMHYALLRNYLGVDEETGSSFMARARDQVVGFGVSLRDERVTAIRPGDGGFEVVVDGGDARRADYIVLATAKKGVELARQLGIATDRDGVDVDTEYRSTVDRVYVVGRLARPGRSQAIISAGAGAVAALDILARESGKDVTDWDTPDDAG